MDKKQILQGSVFISTKGDEPYSSSSDLCGGHCCCQKQEPAL